MRPKIKVLICDDHSLFREGVKTALMHKEDISIVGEAIDGVDLLNKLNFIDVDVILLDINMPRMDGMAVLPVLKSNEKYCSIKVIILSMHNQMSMVSKMMSLGANSYLTKSHDSETIYEAIVTCYQKDYYFNDLTNKSLLNTLKKNPTAFIEDDEFIETENRRKQKQVNQPKVEKQTNYWNSLSRGLLMGVVACLVFLIFYFFKTLSNNLNLSNFNP